MIRKLLKNSRAASGIEYGLLLALVAFVVVNAVTGFGQEVSAVFGDADNGINAVVEGGGGDNPNDPTNLNWGNGLAYQNGGTDTSSTIVANNPSAVSIDLSLSGAQSGTITINGTTTNLPVSNLSLPANASVYLKIVTSVTNGVYNVVTITDATGGGGLGDWRVESWGGP